MRLWVEERGEKVGNFGVSPNGDVTLLKPMDYELRQKYTFLVHATDGIMVKQIDFNPLLNYLKNLNRPRNLNFLCVLRMRLRKWKCACWTWTTGTRGFGTRSTTSGSAGGSCRRSARWSDRSRWPTATTATPSPSSSGDPRQGNKIRIYQKLY